MKEFTMKDYEIPLIEIIEVKVEQGFATSENNGGMNLPSWEII